MALDSDPSRTLRVLRVQFSDACIDALTFLVAAPIDHSYTIAGIADEAASPGTYGDREAASNAIRTLIDYGLVEPVRVNGIVMWRATEAGRKAAACRFCGAKLGVTSHSGGCDESESIISAGRRSHRGRGAGVGMTSQPSPSAATVAIRVHCDGCGWNDSALPTAESIKATLALIGKHCGETGHEVNIDITEDGHAK